MKKPILAFFIIFVFFNSSYSQDISSVPADTLQPDKTIETKSDLNKTKYFVGAGISTFNFPEIFMLSAGVSFELTQNIFLSPQFDYYLTNEKYSDYLKTSLSAFMSYGFEITTNSLFNYIGFEGAYSSGSYFIPYISDKIEQKISKNTYLGFKIRMPLKKNIPFSNFHPEFNLFFTQNY